MTGAGIALIVGGLAALVALRWLLGSDAGERRRGYGGRVRRTSAARRADRTATRERWPLAALPAGPVSGVPVSPAVTTSDVDRSEGWWTTGGREDSGGLAVGDPVSGPPFWANGAEETWSAMDGGPANAAGTPEPPVDAGYRPAAGPWSGAVPDGPTTTGWWPGNAATAEIPRAWDLAQAPEPEPWFPATPVSPVVGPLAHPVPAGPTATPWPGAGSAAPDAWSSEPETALPPAPSWDPTPEGRNGSPLRPQDQSGWRSWPEPEPEPWSGTGWPAEASSTVVAVAPETASPGAGESPHVVVPGGAPVLMALAGAVPDPVMPEAPMSVLAAASGPLPGQSGPIGFDAADPADYAMSGPAAREPLAVPVAAPPAVPVTAPPAVPVTAPPAAELSDVDLPEAAGGHSGPEPVGRQAEAAPEERETGSSAVGQRRRRLVPLRRLGRRSDAGTGNPVEPSRQQVIHPRAEARRRLTATTEVIPAVSDLTALLPAVREPVGAADTTVAAPGPDMQRLRIGGYVEDPRRIDGGTRPDDTARGVGWAADDWGGGSPGADPGEGSPAAGWPSGPAPVATAAPRRRPRPRPRPAAGRDESAGVDGSNGNDRSNVYVSRHAAEPS